LLQVVVLENPRDKTGRKIEASADLSGHYGNSGSITTVRGEAIRHFLAERRPT
jgi:hypothetical protein